MWTIKNYEEVYTRYSESGLSVDQFCLNEQISRSRFYYWYRKYKKLPQSGISIISSLPAKPSDKRNAGFIPLLITSGNDTQIYPLKPDIDKSSQSPPLSSDPCSFMEVSFPNGTTIRLRGDINSLRTKC